MEHDSAPTRHTESSADVTKYHDGALHYQRRYLFSTRDKSVALQKIIEERLSLYLDPVTLIHVANLYHDRLDKYWNITRALLDYFQRPTLLRDVLRRSGSIIFGAFAHRFFSREVRPVHMHIAVGDTKDLAQHLTAVEGYVKTEFEGPLEYVIGDTKVKHFEKQKTLRSGLVATIRITLVQGEPGVHPFWTVLDKISTTAQLNFITADHAYSLFPYSTFRHERSHWLKDLSKEAIVGDDVAMAGTSQETVMARNAKLVSFDDYRIDLRRRSTMVGNSAEHPEFSTRRRPGDKWTWTIDFEGQTSETNGIAACEFYMNTSADGTFFSLSSRASDYSLQNTSSALTEPRSGAFPLLSRQLRTPRPPSLRVSYENSSTNSSIRRASRTFSDVDMGDDHGSFSDHAERLLSLTPERAVNDKCKARRKRIGEIKIELEKMASELPLLSPAEAKEVQTQMFLAELWLALIQTESDITLASFEAVRSGDEVALEQPRRRVALGWLSESIKRLENPSQGVDPLSRNLFKEISNVFMAGIINSEADTFFTGRALPPFLDIVGMFDTTNPQEDDMRNSHLGPTLTRLTRLKFVNDQSVEEVLLRIEQGVASTNLAPFISPRLFGPTDSRTNSPLISRSGRPRLNYDTIDPALLEGDPDYEVWLSQKTQEQEVERARKCLSDSSEANDTEAQDESSGLSEHTDQRIYSTQQRGVEERSEQMEQCKSSGDSSQTSTSTYSSSKLKSQWTVEPAKPEVAASQNPLSMFRQSQAERDAAFQEEMRRSNGRIPDHLFVTPSPIPPAASPLLIHLDLPIQVPGITTNPENHQKSYVDIEDISSDPTSTHSESTIDPYEDDDDSMQDASDAQGQDDMEAVQETIEIPTRTPPKTQTIPRVRSRRSEPIVLISTPVPPTILDTDFVSEHEDDGPPASSHPQLAALLQKSSARASNSNTPTSSASAVRTPKPKLPPHLAPTRIAAHRRSLDPSSQIPSPEEKEKSSQEEYPLVDIIDERRIGGVKKYLIKWKPITGRTFANTWEPVENANAAAVEDWHRKLANRRENARKQRNKHARRIVEETGTEPILEPAPAPELDDLEAVRNHDMTRWRESGGKGKKPKLSDQLRAQRRQQKEEARRERIAKKAAERRAGVLHGLTNRSASTKASMALQVVREAKIKRQKDIRKKENKAKKLLLRETQRQAASVRAAEGRAGPSDS
ncbi:hypothetical protein E4T39_06254 [Aureobasidium subglaciale]|nr:hypothetical protein E4T39_06254 [Aureobasidium subglaciale]